MTEPARDHASGVIAPSRRWVLVVLVLGTVAALTTLLSSALLRGQGPGRGGLAVNTEGRAGSIRVRPAPPFTLHLFDGGTLRLEDERGLWVVVCLLYTSDAADE